MAFTRACGTFLISAFQRATGKNPLTSVVIRMSSQTSLTQPPEMENGSSNRYALGAALGGLLTCGLGFAYKTYTDQNMSFCKQFQASCEGQDECPPKCEESTCLHKMDKEEEVIAKANADLEKALKDLKPKAVEATEAALKAYCEAAEMVKLFMDKGYCAIEHDELESPQFEEVWCDVYDTALKRCEKMLEAMTRAQCAWELICRLSELIENGRCCKYTQSNPLLITAEEALLCAERELLNAKARVDCIQSNSCLVEQYRSLIEDFRRDLKVEVEAILACNPECKASFCENECPMIMTQAYKMVLRVQKELAQLQVCNEKVPSKQQKTLC